ncbi:tyrosine-type recombinase/integrase, partial [Streptomyces sp. NPDC059556]|uniref:tyrosine-type recombinase/integrase n=1 Tax=Streptomyces sp. NPDC059556 TaxID=3346863 RepID=UPI0036BE419A
GFQRGWLRPDAVGNEALSHNTRLPPTGWKWLKERETAGPDWRDNSLVFTTPIGRPLDPANLTRRFRSFLNRAGLRRIRFHDLRHSTATLLLEQGVDLVVIKELLGHAHIGVTADVYAHVRLRLQRQAIDTLNNALGAADDPPATEGVR